MKDKLHLVAAALCAALTLALAGCATTRDGGDALASFVDANIRDRHEQFMSLPLEDKIELVKVWRQDYKDLEKSIRNVRDFLHGRDAGKDRPSTGTPSPDALATQIYNDSASWKYGGFKPGAPTEVWHGTARMERGTARIVFDYAGAPEWFTRSGSDAPFVVGVLYPEGCKFDWIGYSRVFRDLKHISDEDPNRPGSGVGYNGWPNHFGAQKPLYGVIFNESRGGNRGQWLIFKVQ